MMREYDLLMLALKDILKKGIICEDSAIRLSNSIKYSLYNLLYELDKKWIDELFKDLDYKEEL